MLCVHYNFEWQYSFNAGSKVSCGESPRLRGLNRSVSKWLLGLDIIPEVDIFKHHFSIGPTQLVRFYQLEILFMRFRQLALDLAAFTR